MIKSKEEIQDFIFLNYEEIRLSLVYKYNEYTNALQDNDSIFRLDINKQFVEIAHYTISHYVHTNTTINFEDIKVYVEDVFTFDNITRIISEDGKI